MENPYTLKAQEWERITRGLQEVEELTAFHNTRLREAQELTRFSWEHLNALRAQRVLLEEQFNHLEDSI